MRPRRLLILFPISFIVILYLLGCVPLNSQKQLPSLTPERTISSSNSPSPILPYTPSPISTTPTLLNPQIAYQSLQELYENNGGCELPCYWKIIPGQTSWQSVSEFVDSVGGVYRQYGTPKIPRYDISFERFDVPIGGISPRIWVENEVVKAIGINSSWVHQDFNYSLSGLLKTFGEPEEIWIRPIAESSDDQPYYYLVLLYPSNGILVNLLGNAERQDQYLVVCPQDIFSRSPFPPQLLLWNPKEQIVFDKDFGTRLIDDDLGWVMDEYRLLEEVSADKLTNMEFDAIYSEPNTKTCMSVFPVR